MTLQKCLSLVMKRLLRQKCATTSVPIRPFGVYLCALKQIVAPDKPTVCCFSIRLVLCKCLMYVYNGAGELFYTWHWIFDGIPNFVISLLLLFYCVSLFTPHFGFLLFLCVCVWLIWPNLVVDKPFSFVLTHYQFDMNNFLRGANKSQRFSIKESIYFCNLFFFSVCLPVYVNVYWCLYK